jgi:hypothetical protein
MSRAKVSFPAFYLKQAQLSGWAVPDEHMEVCDWLEGGRRGRVGVLKAFRGFSKSTIAGRYVPWKLRHSPTWRFQLLSATDTDGAKMSRDSRNVIDRHPWCQGMRPERFGLWKTHRYEVTGADDPRNPSVSAYGVMSNITGGRADECINDDVEVPKTIRTPALREALRERLSEQTHIIVPGGKILYIGTDHCLDSIYKEQIEDGADLLEISLFRKEVTHIAKTVARDFPFSWRIQTENDLFIVVGGTRPRLLDREEYLVEGVRDYRGGHVRLRKALNPEERISIYAGHVWPERFTRDEVKFRVGRCRSWGAWDSQYQLHAAQIGDVRLDPARMIEYSPEPEFREVNGELTCWLNGLRMAGVSTVWDCSLGKVKSDTSALVVIFTDSRGYLFWHLAEALTGDIDEQCLSVVKTVKRLRLPAVTVKTASLGGFVPTILKGHLQRAGVPCGVIEQQERVNKNVRILDALEPPLSGLFLYAHQSVKQGPAAVQMGQWNPKILDQPDDYLDAAAGAVAETPIRIGKIPGGVVEPPRDEWRPNQQGNFEVQVDYGR